jgi:hypothetical protein
MSRQRNGTDERIEKRGRDEVQGEGDRESAARYNEATHEFVESGKVDEAAGKAQGQDPAEARDAEQTGLERARETDPAVHRDYSKPTRD